MSGAEMTTRAEPGIWREARPPAPCGAVAGQRRQDNVERIGGTMPDSELVMGILKGEIDYAVLQKEYERRVYKWLYNMVRNAADAEDLTESVFVGAYESLDRYDPAKASLYTWLHTMTYNMAVSFLRKRKHAPESLDVMTDAEAPAVAGPDEVHETEQRLAKLRRLVNKLSPRLRQAAYGFYVRRESWREVAAELNCSERTARYLAWLAIKRLREEL